MQRAVDESASNGRTTSIDTKWSFVITTIHRWKWFVYAHLRTTRTLSARIAQHVMTYAGRTREERDALNHMVRPSLLCSSTPNSNSNVRYLFSVCDSFNDAVVSQLRRPECRKESSGARRERVGICDLRTLDRISRVFLSLHLTPPSS